MNLLRTEPVAIFGALQTALMAVVVALTEFDVWSPTDGQITALAALYLALTAIATIFLRGQVSPASESATGIPGDR